MSPKLIGKPPFTVVTDAFSVGRVIPVLIALVGVWILVSGLFPLHWFRFQDYEMARQILQWDAPFIPDFHVRTKYFVGDEAQAANLPPTEHLPWRDFTTDSFGFRFTPAVHPGQPPEIVVFRGFSFVFGVGLSDEQTFPAQLARAAGVNAYNAARFHEDPETPEDFDDLMAKIGARPKTVVYVHLEPNQFYVTPETQRRDSFRRALRFAKEYPMTWIRFSPAIWSAMDAKKAVENDRILNNRYRDSVASFPMPDGRRILVRKGDLERVQTAVSDDEVRDRSEYIAWWNQRIAERGANMIVLLVPEKMSVYGPSLGVKLPENPFLNRMERELTAQGVKVVNGLTLLRATAEADLASGHLAYLREDQHWNVEGVRRLANAVADAIAALPPALPATESSRIR